MDDLISRQALVAQFEQYDDFDEICIDTVFDILNDAPTIEAADVAEVRHGRWNYDDGYNTCSVCGSEFTDYDANGRRQWFYYCPNCSAKMDKEK